ncbi:NAD(P)-dependent oxidoreductase [Bacteroidia bacterium]|nr:NAD(P)-dependent oxidoreductase [Bacteroidia bacterium]MDB9881745.1 NAD(P)-dependent oxidoreductase [Bacteroidia bacterium]
MKKVLITGSNGLLGQKLLDLYLTNDKIKIIATARGANRYPIKAGYTYTSMDITDETSVQQVIAEHTPDCIINTAAMTNVDICESDKEGCDKLNIDAVSYLVKAANANNAHLIHLSTDFIFDGKNGPYTEEDEPNPLSHYGLSKLKSETIIQEKCNKWSIARTVLVYGVVQDMSRSNIVLWAKGALEKGQPINVVNDQFRSPTLAEDLAKGCQLVEEKEAEGIYNISGKDQMSILEIVHRVADYFKLDKSIISVVSSSTLNQAAKRPPLTGFDLTKSRKVLGYEPRSFEEGIAVLMEQVG